MHVQQVTRRKVLNSATNQNENISSWSTSNFFVPDTSDTQLHINNNIQNSEFENKNNKKSDDSLPSSSIIDIQKYIADRISNSIMNTSTDRTTEFLSVVNILKQKHAADPQIRTQATNNISKNGKPGGGVALVRQRQEFNSHAKLVGKNLSKTFEKLEKLTLLCKKRTLFDDRPVEISELTHIIKQDIDGLKRSLINLETCSRSIPNNGRKDVANQTRTQIKELTSRVGVASKSFLNVMELRRENIKIQNERRQHFQGTPKDASTKRNQNQTGQAFAAFAAEQSSSVLWQDDLRSQQNGNVPESAIFASNYQDMQMMQQEDNYAQEREKNMETIESAIVEIGQVMRQLGNMVAEQQETVMRIDSNIDSTEMSIDAAHGEILKYFQSVTNNRWLMVKVFGTLVLFFIIFIVFFS